MSSPPVTRASSQQAQTPSASELSKVEEQLKNMVLADKAGPRWSFALKPPKSEGLLVLECEGASDDSWQEKNDGHAWLKDKMLNKGWTGWICYNDQPPETTAAMSSYGHCKGIFAWSSTRLGWLIHSMPRWPKTFSDTDLSPFVESGVENGQCFMWITLKRTDELTRGILHQIRVMRGFVHANQESPVEDQRMSFIWLDKQLRKVYSKVPSLIELAPGMWHMAIFKKWGRGPMVLGKREYYDFWEDALAQTKPFDGFWHVQSWLKGDGDPLGRTPNCDNILAVRLPDGEPYKTTKDHAKWGVHSEKPLAAVGDLNRMHSQSKRAGGALILCNRRLRDSLNDLIRPIGAKHPDMPALPEADRFHMSPMRHPKDQPVDGMTAGTGTGAGAGASGSAGAWGSMAAANAAAASLSIPEAGEVAAAASGVSKGCRCKTPECSHRRCGCRKKGQLCTAKCGCKGKCAAAEAPKAGATATDDDSKPEAEECMAAAEERGAAVNLHATAAADAAALGMPSLAASPAALHTPLNSPQRAAFHTPARAAVHNDGGSSSAASYGNSVEGASTDADSTHMASTVADDADAGAPENRHHCVDGAEATSEAEASHAADASSSGSEAGEVAAAASGVSKGCRCKTPDCSHRRCGCHKKGQLCTVKCGCKGKCAAR